MYGIIYLLNLSDSIVAVKHSAPLTYSKLELACMSVIRDESVRNDFIGEAQKDYSRQQKHLRISLRIVFRLAEYAEAKGLDLKRSIDGGGQGSLGENVDWC